MSDPDIVLVFIGESGSGKSTCINYFANYFAGTGYTQLLGFSKMFVVIPNRLFPTAVGGYVSRESNIADNTKSQTKECSEYQFVQHANQVKKVIKVVDTPGFNDTDASRDDENIKKIIIAFEKLRFVSAIIITINGSVARLSTSLKATLSQLRGSLPDSLFDNLFFIFTNCEETTRNFKLGLIDEYKPLPSRIFHMQNSLFSVSSMAEINSDPKKQRRVESNWNDSMETISELMEEVSRTTAGSTAAFGNMRIKREALLSNKANLILKQKSLLDIMQHISIESDRLKNAQATQTVNKDFGETKEIDTIEIEKKSYYSTVCNESSHGRMQVCHENCGLGYEPTLNYNHFKNCAASDGSNCRHCKCSMNVHYHTYEIPVVRKKTISNIISTKKAAFDQATQQIGTSQRRLQDLDKIKNDLQAEVNGCKQGILDCIRGLKSICSHYNFVEEMHATIENLRKESKVSQDLHAKTEFSKTADAIESLVKQLTIAR